MSDAELHLLHQLLNSGQTRGRNYFLRQTAAEFVIEHGWWYAPKPTVTTKGEPSQCFTNAFLLAMKHPEMSYVEGYAIATADGTRTAHAWLTDRQGQAIEVTWDRPGAAYGGIPFKLDFLGRRLRDDGEIGSMIDDFMHDWPLLREGGPSRNEWWDEAGIGREKISVPDAF